MDLPGRTNNGTRVFFALDSFTRHRVFVAFLVHINDGTSLSPLSCNVRFDYFFNQRDSEKPYGIMQFDARITLGLAL